MTKRCIAGFLATLVYDAAGARISRHQKSATASKQLAGVPVLNYDRAYGGARAGHATKEHWLVVAESGVSDERLQELCHSASMCEMVGHPDAGGVPFFQVFATERELEKVLYQAPGELAFAEPDGTVSLDPDEDTAEPASSASWGLDRVGAPSRFATGAGVHIYVMDTGVRITHREFGGRAVNTIDTAGGRLNVCGVEDTRCARDRRGHGTHCAGSAAGDTYGVAVGATVHAAKVLNDQGSGTWSATFLALDWVAANGERPAVAGMSLGAAGTQSAMQRAVDAAVDAGVVVVVASGNQNQDACFYSPAFVDSAITVGSTTSTDEMSSFSNYGSCVEIWAPGSSIVSSDRRSDTDFSTKSGTSMACPHVAGGAALVLSQNPGFSASAVLSALLDNAERNAISGLTFSDTNALLWVGSGPAPVPAPTPGPPPVVECPDFAASRQPDSSGDCLCANQQSCSTDGVNRNCPTSRGIGAFQGRWFTSSCEDCRCYALP
jgi:subtilisin family serine protease